jgi:hypothetical protein
MLRSLTTLSSMEGFLRTIDESRMKDKTYIKQFLRSSGIRDGISRLKTSVEDACRNLMVRLRSTP